MESTVETSRGRLRGRVEDGVTVFRGVSYARPPVGPLRFQPPQPVTPWAGVRDALQFGPAAPQNTSPLGPVLGLDIKRISEDCLSLNVWTPAADHGKRPVLVWIHGGAFVIGAGFQVLYDGATLARHHDVVVVTINYRLGAFGFLRLDDLSDGAIPATGTEGLQDQIAALAWVRDEIAAFGGDPGNVTIFGESAGAISVATLLGTPSARGLFHRAVLESGSANMVASPRHATLVAEALVRELDLGPRDLHRLHELTTEQILDAQQRMYLKIQSQVHGIPFEPVYGNDVLPRHPFAAIGEGLSADVPVLAGTTIDEMKLFGFMDPQARALDLPALKKRCERVLAGCGPDGARHADDAIAAYTEARRARGESTVPSELWFAIDSDRVFRSPAMRLAELQRAHTPHVHAYLFTWASPFMEGALGACHALEIPFVFGTLHHPMVASFAGSGPDAERLSAAMQNAWAAFARTGTPEHRELGRWPAYDATHRSTVVLGRDITIEDAPREPERRFWDFWDGVIYDG